MKRGWKSASPAHFESGFHSPLLDEKRMEMMIFNVFSVFQRNFLLDEKRMEIYFPINPAAIVFFCSMKRGWKSERLSCRTSRSPAACSMKRGWKYNFVAVNCKNRLSCLLDEKRMEIYVGYQHKRIIFFCSMKRGWKSMET